MRAIPYVLVLGIWLAISSAARATDAPCAGDLNGDAEVTIDEIITAVNNALSGCPNVAPTPTPSPCTGTYTCTCSSAFCGSCGVGGSQGDVRENVSCDQVQDFCLYKDGPCNNPNLAGCDGSHVFEHGWTCVPTP